MTGPVRALLRELDRVPGADLALRLTLVALLFKPVGGAWTRPVIALLAATGLLFEAPRRSAWLWSALLALCFWRVASGWPLGDNHAYLLCYWLLAALVASLARDGERVLAWNGRILLGLVFAFAVLWKLQLSPDYLDGRFFLVTLVDDRRFEDFTRLAAGLDGHTLDALRALVREHRDGLRPPAPGDPALPARLVALAHGLGISLLLIEAVVAAAFLAPRSWRLSRARDGLLLAFCSGTYALAPVEGFGWLLLGMGVAQCEPARVGVRRTYLVVFALVLLTSRWPWLRALAET
jgi:hypothetical protein